MQYKTEKQDPLGDIWISNDCIIIQSEHRFSNFHELTDLEGIFGYVS